MDENKPNQASQKKRISFFSAKKHLNIKAGGEMSSHELHESAFVRLEAIEKKRTRVRSLVLVLSVVLVMALTIGVVELLMQRKNKQPVLQFLSEDTVDESFEAQGIIVRDEVIYASGIDGIIRPLQPEGTKVARGERVAIVLSDRMQKTYEEWKDLVKQIAKRRLELIAQGQGKNSSQIFADTDLRLTSLINELRKASSVQELKNDESFQNSIDALIYSRNLELDAVVFEDEALSKLQDSLKAIDEKLLKGAAYIKTDSSGYISYMSDGLESILTPETLNALNEDSLKQIISKGENFKPISENVKKTNPAYRLAKGTGHRLVIRVKDLPPSYFEIGEGARHISLYLPKEGIKIEDCIVRAINESTEGTILTVTTSSQVEHLIDRRIVEGRIVVSRTYGFKVPNAVLMDYKESLGENEVLIREAKLMMVSGGVTKLVKVNVLSQNDRFSVIKNFSEEQEDLSSGAIYVENPSEVKEGQAID